MITAPDRILTPRLLLRKPVPGDAREICASYAGAPEVTRYLQWRADGSLGGAEKFVARTLANWEGGSAYAWSILLRGDGSFLGMIEARIDAYMVNLGYVIGRAHWNRGFATEAVKAVCAWAEAEPDVFRIWAVCAADNFASVRVLEKAGMTPEGPPLALAVFPNIGGAPRKCLSYSLVREFPLQAAGRATL
jgi:[ribosomal protein S5]-alanine N-acetyltransferase